MARLLQESFFAVGEGLCSGVRQKLEVEGLRCGDAGMWCCAVVLVEEGHGVFLAARSVFGGCTPG